MKKIKVDTNNKYKKEIIVYVKKGKVFVNDLEVGQITNRGGDYYKTPTSGRIRTKWINNDWRFEWDRDLSNLQKVLEDDTIYKSGFIYSKKLDEKAQGEYNPRFLKNIKNGATRISANDIVYQLRCFISSY